MNISYTLNTEECFKHSYEKTIIHLNYDDDKNMDIQTEQEKFEDIIDDSLLRNSDWYLVPTVFVTFNIDQCLPNRTDKISISLFCDKLTLKKKKNI